MDLFAQLERTPPWLDPRALRLATGTILRCAIGTYTALAASSLIGGYRSARAVKPLVMTGALELMAPRRLAETGQFIMEVARSRLVGRRSAGFQAAVRVRLTHAAVRHVLRRSPKWRADLWGTPINQHDTLGTMLLFSVAYAHGLSRLGFLLSRAELEALVHLWRYVALLLGAPEDLLPASYPEALELSQRESLRRADADGDSRALTAALLNVPRTEARDALYSRGVGELTARFLGGYSRHVLGPEVADDLALPNDAWQFAPLLLRPFVSGLEVLRLLTPGGSWIAARLGLALQTGFLRRRMVGKATPFYHRAGAT